ncbi:MAG: sensor histidine kinase [Rhodospirillales bacterium]
MKRTGPRSLLSGLSFRLLLLTIGFVMLAELLIWTPSISRFRLVYLNEHLASGHLAALALQATPDKMVSRDLEERLLFHAGAYAIALKSADRESLMLASDPMPMVAATYDIRNPMLWTMVMDAFEALGRDDNRIIRAIGPSPKDPDVTVEVVLNEAPLRHAMVDFSNRILQLSIVISLITAGLVFATLQWLMVKPVHHLTESLVRFREQPEAENAVIRPSRRTDEIGLAERELADMQVELRAALKQKTRLAALGEAMTKVNHDLRNTLTTAVLASDRLQRIDDPEVKRLAPRLITAIGRATDLCSQTLTFARDPAATIHRTDLNLADLVDEVSDFLTEEGLPGDPGAFSVINDVDPEICFPADHAQMHRALNNLIRNAAEAGATSVFVGAAVAAGGLTVHVRDDGPGLPEGLNENLFQPFARSTRKGGTGLGLAIVRDLVRAHGGEIHLVESGPAGTHFRIDLPRPPDPAPV